MKIVILFINHRDLKGSQSEKCTSRRPEVSVGWIIISHYHRDPVPGRCRPSPVLVYEGFQLPIPTPGKISPTLLEMPPNSWPNEAFSLRSDARAFLIRGTQYPLSPWPGSEISQVMGGTVDTRSSSLPPT